MPVKPHIMVLGPARDIAGEDWPLKLRFDVEKDLRERLKCPAVVMERVPDVDDENAARKFARIIRDWDVRTYLVVWPKGCRLNGLNVELGWLANEIVNGRLDARDVVLATQADHIGIAEEQGEGVWSMSETGNRTRYYEALIDEGCTVRKYQSLADLSRNVTATSMEHVQRHILNANPSDFVGKAAARWAKSKDKGT